jgi:hypothetical protein
MSVCGTFLLKPWEPIYLLIQQICIEQFKKRMKENGGGGEFKYEIFDTF